MNAGDIVTSAAAMSEADLAEQEHGSNQAGAGKRGYRARAELIPTKQRIANRVGEVAHRDGARQTKDLRIRRPRPRIDERARLLKGGYLVARKRPLAEFVEAQ